MARTGGGWQRSLALIAAAAPLLNACASPPAAFEPAASRPAAQPGIGTYRVGEPYEVHGVWYYPAVDYNYDRVGVASWYGEAFQGRLTANGEIFDLNGLTAAHTTLPMPSIVQVTDLENGRSLQLRVNDRGPFVDGRMIDVSRRAAQLLGFEQKGTAVVRVTVLKEESIAAAEDAMRNRGQVMVAQASNTATAPPPAPSYEPATGPSSRLAALPAPKPAPPTVAMAGPARGSVAPSPPAAGTAAPRPAPVAVAPVVVAANEPPPKPLPPPRPRSLFSLIARAEAAELPPDFAVPRKKAAASTAIGGSAHPAAAPHTASPSRPVFVQAGAFANRSNALRAEARIARLGSVHVAAAAINGVAVYRVRLGPVGSHEQAKILLNRVVDSGFREARIVGD